MMPHRPLQPRSVARLPALLLTAATMIAAGPAQGQPAPGVRAPTPFPEATAQDAQRLLPLLPTAPLFEFTRGDREGERTHLRLHPIDHSGEIWRYELDDRRIGYISAAADGSVLLHDIVLRDAEYHLDYERPVTLVPAGLRPGESLTETRTVTAFELPSGEVYGRGTAEHTVTAEGGATVRTAAGPVEVELIRIEHVIRLRGATITINMLTGYHPDVGRVYQAMTFEQRALLIFTERESETLIYASGR